MRFVHFQDAYVNPNHVQKIEKVSEGISRIHFLGDTPSTIVEVGFDVIAEELNECLSEHPESEEDLYDTMRDVANILRVPDELSIEDIPIFGKEVIERCELLVDFLLDSDAELPAEIKAAALAYQDWQEGG